MATGKKRAPKGLRRVRRPIFETSPHHKRAKKAHAKAKKHARAATTSAHSAHAKASKARTPRSAKAAAKVAKKSAVQAKAAVAEVKKIVHSSEAHEMSLYNAGYKEGKLDASRGRYPKRKLKRLLAVGASRVRKPRVRRTTAKRRTRKKK